MNIILETCKGFQCLEKFGVNQTSDLQKYINHAFLEDISLLQWEGLLKIEHIGYNLRSVVTILISHNWDELSSVTKNERIHLCFGFYTEEGMLDFILDSEENVEKIGIHATNYSAIFEGLVWSFSTAFFRDNLVLLDFIGCFGLLLPNQIINSLYLLLREMYNKRQHSTG